MLSDNVIHGFDILCKRHFEHVEGFQDLLLGQTLQNSVIKYQKFEQILHKYQHLLLFYQHVLSVNIIGKTTKSIITTAYFRAKKWFCEATNMRIVANRWGCAEIKCHARPTANKFSRLWDICNGIFNLHFVWWRLKINAWLCISDVSRTTRKTFSKYRK